MPYEIRSEGTTLNIYSQRQIVQQIYSWTQKRFPCKEVFPIYANYFVQIRFAKKEIIEKYTTELEESFASQA